MTVNYMSSAGVAKYLGLSPTTIATYQRDDRMPEPDVSIGTPPSIKYGWSKQTIDQWVAGRPGKGGRPPKVTAEVALRAAENTK